LLTTPEFSIRELEDSDLPALAQLLAEGFPRKSLGAWQSALAQLQQRQPAPGTPRYGYGIDSDGLQGATLTIGSLHGPVDDRQTIVNISSWTVRASHRGGPAKELYRYASSFDGATYSNLSAAPHTLKTITQFGFREGTAGQMIAIGTGSVAGVRCRIVAGADAERVGLAAETGELLGYHAQRGCLALCLELPGRLVPLLFLTRRIKPGIPVAQLIYCERLDDLQDHSRRVYLWLLRRGYLAMLIDVSGPARGLTGRYYPGRAAKFYKGPMPRYAVDHSYSEMIYIGF